jgi:hypothetical protein
MEATMRAIVVVVVALASSLAAAAAAAQTPASGKTASSWKCAAPNPTHTVPVAGHTNHAYVVSSSQCTALKGEIAGVVEKSGVATEFIEVMGDKAKGHGIFFETLANGDTLTVSYEFTGTMKNQQFQSGSNKWTVMDGTGKLKGSKGQGTCTAKGSPDGSLNFDCTGTYTLAQ